MTLFRQVQQEEWLQKDEEEVQGAPDSGAGVQPAASSGLAAPLPPAAPDSGAGVQQAAGSAPAMPPPPAAASPVAEVQPAAVSGADGQRSKGNGEGADEPGGGTEVAAPTAAGAAAPAEQSQIPGTPSRSDVYAKERLRSAEAGGVKENMPASEDKPTAAGSAEEMSPPANSADSKVAVRKPEHAPPVRRVQSAGSKPGGLTSFLSFRKKLPNFGGGAGEEADRTSNRETEEPEAARNETADNQEAERAADNQELTDPKAKEQVMQNVFEAMQKEEAERELTEIESTKARETILDQVIRRFHDAADSEEQNDSRGMSAFYETWLKAEELLRKQEREKLVEDLAVEEEGRELTETELLKVLSKAIQVSAKFTTRKNLIKELGRLCNPWREGGPPGYLRSSLLFLDPMNGVLQKQMGEHELEDGSMVFWRKPGGRFSWSNSKEWISDLTWKEVKEYGNKNTTTFVLTLTTNAATDIESTSSILAAAAEPTAAVATSEQPTPSTLAAPATGLIAHTFRLQEAERIAVAVAVAAGNIDKSLVTVSVQRTTYTATIAMTASTQSCRDSLQAAVQTNLASTLGDIPCGIPVSAAKLCRCKDGHGCFGVLGVDRCVGANLAHLTIASTSLDLKEPRWREQAKKAAEEAKEHKTPEEAKAEKGGEKPTFRMCTASEVQKVLSLAGGAHARAFSANKLKTLYPEDNQWVAYTGW